MRNRRSLASARRPPESSPRTFHGLAIAIRPPNAKQRPREAADLHLYGADDGIRTRDPNLGKADGRGYDLHKRETWRVWWPFAAGGWGAFLIVPRQSADLSRTWNEARCPPPCFDATQRGALLATRRSSGPA